MSRKIKIIVFLVLLLFAILYLNNRINAFDMRFYYGKDNGVFVRFELIVISSALFFLLMARKNRIFNSAIGFIIGIFSGVIGYFFAIYIPTDSFFDFLYHLIATSLYIIAFFQIEKLSTSKK